MKQMPWLVNEEKKQTIPLSGTGVIKYPKIYCRERNLCACKMLVLIVRVECGTVLRTCQSIACSYCEGRLGEWRVIYVFLRKGPDISHMKSERAVAGNCHFNNSTSTIGLLHQ